MGYDLVIRNGTVVDGSGREPFRADVAVQGDRIVGIGAVPESGRREIDADGHVVTPGFVDGHTHMDAQVFWDAQGSCSCWHGVTSVLMGNCGFTLAPARPHERGLVIRNLERAEDISAAAMSEGIDWTWETFPEYLAAVEALPKGINYSVNVGHSALRTWAMGERAFEGGATPDDLATMENALLYALSAGALGLSTSRTHNHETSDDRPVASRMAGWEEVRHLANVVGRAGGGLFELALEDDCLSDDPAVRAEPYERLRALALESGVSVTFGIVATKDLGGPQLDFIDSTVAAGGRAFGQTHSRGVSAILSFKTNMPYDSLPEWRELRKLPLDAQRAAFLDPDKRARLTAIAKAGDYARQVGAAPRKPDYDFIKVLDQPMPPNPTVAELARSRGVDPVDLVIDLALESDFDQMFVQTWRRYEDDELVAAMKHPNTAMTFSDAGAHVSQISDSSIQTHLLGYWVRRREAISLQDAVRIITYEPARRFGIPDRGLLKLGYTADINVLDPATVGPKLPWVDNDLPGGGKRLKQRSAGFLATIVAGTPTYENGSATGALPGRLLRRRVQ
jgi:N-acyl-D-aspartate/D-glutamate deacylase